MSSLRNRVVRLEQKSPAETGVRCIVRTIVSGPPGGPHTEELHSVSHLSGGNSPSQEFTRVDDETEADFRARAGFEE